MNRPELPLHPHRAQDHRTQRRAELGTAIVACLGLSACVAPPELPPLRVEPNYRLDHAGVGLAPGYAMLARRYEGEARWPEALKAWLKAVQAAPGDAELHNALGQAYAGQGDHEAAVTALRRAVELAPDEAALHNNLGYALMRAGRTEEARTALQQALASQPGYARAQANLRRLQASAEVMQERAEQAAPTAPATPVASVSASETVAPATSAISTSTQATAQAPGVPRTIAAHQPSPTAPAVEIANGNGVEGMAACVAEALRASGALSTTRLRNALPYDTATTVVRYRAGHAQVAQALARQLPGGAPAVAGLDRADSLDLRIVLGHDLRTRGPCARPG
jgi:tetratricopeptide (TPR) repeat protein